MAADGVSGLMDVSAASRLAVSGLLAVSPARHRRGAHMSRGCGSGCLRANPRYMWLLFLGLARGLRRKASHPTSDTGKIK